MTDNPYAPSAIEAAPPPTAKTQEELALLRRQLNEQCIALAGFWFFIGIGLIFAGEFGRQNLPTRFPTNWSQVFETSLTVSCFLMGGVGIAWIVLGVLTAFRVERAVRIGLISTYALLLFPAIWITIFGLFVLPLVIAQAHRVLTCLEALQQESQQEPEVTIVQR